MSRRARTALPRWSHFVIPVALCALVVGLRYILSPLLGQAGPYFLSALAVTVSAFIGGVWPGLLATTISTAAGTLLFVEPQSASFLNSPSTRLVIAAQIAVCVCISMICGALRASEAEAAAVAEKEHEARSRLNALFNSITDKFVTVSRSLTLLSYNPAAAERWGIGPEHIGRHISEALPKTILGALRAPLERALELGHALSIEVQDGSTGQTYEVRAFPSPEGLLVYFHNISQKIAANDAIAKLAVDQEQANSLLDSLLSHAPLGFAFFDREYRFQRLNEQLAEMNGLPLSEHLGKTIREVVPVNAPFMEPVIDQVFLSGQAVDQLEIKGETPKAPGETRHWHAGFYPVVDAQGQVKSVGAIAIEITQRKEMENQLRQSEFRFRNLTDNSPMMIWVCDPDGAASWFNKPWLDFRGLSLEDVLREGCFAHIHPEDEPWVKEMKREAFLAEESFSVEFRTLSASAEYRWIHVKANPVHDEEGKVISYLMSSLDVTDRIGMEENLRRSLANERAARSDAEEANRLRDEFLAGLSHELRTPLTTMLGWTELLMKPKVRDTELVEGLQVIQRSSKLQLQLINDLLDMSRISIGKINLEFEYAELSDTVQSVVDLVKTSASEKNIAVTFLEPKEPIVVRLDPDRFTQIVWNLLSNAIKFTPSGGKVTIEVGANQDMAYTKVTDSGVGIEASFLPHVFDRFRQADASRSRRHGGLGLGLAIAKQLTDLHGGFIEVASDGPNMGCVFTVTIPIAETPPTPYKVKSKPAPAEVDDSRRLVDVCILLVEDDASSREVLRRMLESEGAVVISADSASVARKLLKETSPDVMVSDIGLPEEDGYQLIRSIRSAMDQNDIPAVALTAFAGGEDRIRAFESGFNMYLTKPVEPDDLVRAVLELSTSEL